jgi:hypothetical protein
MKEKVIAKKIMECLDGNPMRLCEIAEATGVHYSSAIGEIERMRAQGTISAIKPYGEVRSGCGASVYYLPQDRDWAWIKFEKLHSQATQAELDVENAILKITAEKGAARPSEYPILYKSANHHLRRLMREDLLQKFRICCTPIRWNGPNESATLYYLTDREKDAAARIMEWIPDGQLSLGEERSLTYFLRGLPTELESEVRALMADRQD